MVKLVKITKSEKPALKEWWFEDKEGNCYYFDMEWMRYDKHVDFDKMVLDTESHEYPTLNDLCAEGRMTAKFCYDEADFDFSDKFPDHREAQIRVKDFNNMLAKMRRKGWKVSSKALEHCISSWLGGLKSGYRDEKNGTHVFVPCGGNPLIVRLTKLHPFCTDWQKTYYA